MDKFVKQAGVYLRYSRNCTNSPTVCMGGDGHGYHHRKKWGINPLSFLRLQSYISAVLFAASWFLGSQPRIVLKKEQQRLTSVAVVMTVRRPPWCITVCSSSFVLILLYFRVSRDVRARVARVCTFSYNFVQYNTN